MKVFYLSSKGSEDNHPKLNALMSWTLGWVNKWIANLYEVEERNAEADIKNNLIWKLDVDLVQ